MIGFLLITYLFFVWFVCVFVSSSTMQDIGDQSDYVAQIYDAMSRDMTIVGKMVYHVSQLDGQICCLFSLACVGIIGPSQLRLHAICEQDYPRI